MRSYSILHAPAVGLTLIFSVCAVRAEASAADKAAAVVLFDAADRAMAEGHFAEACPKYAESNHLDPQIGALIRLADCYEKAGQTASAWTSWRDAADLCARRGDSREAGSRERASGLDGKLVRVTVVVPPGNEVPGLEVRRGAQVVGRALWGAPVPVDPGPQIFEARAPGYKTWTTTVAMEGAGQRSIEVPALEVEPTTEVVAPGTHASGAVTRDVPSGSSRGSTHRLLGWTAVGAGAVGLGVGLIFEIQRSARLSDRDGVCPTRQNCSPDDQAHINSLTSDARGAATVEVVGFIAGGLFAAGGLALVFTAPKADTRGTTANNLTVLPVAVPGFQGVTLAGRGW
jgi:hypothetical protein